MYGNDDVELLFENIGELLHGHKAEDVANVLLSYLDRLVTQRDDPVETAQGLAAAYIKRVEDHCARRAEDRARRAARYGQG